MAENKTQATDGDVAAFLAAVEPAPKRADAEALCEVMARITGAPATMWGSAIVGFGTYRYRYESGREGSACRIGFSPRKAYLALYGMGIARNAALLDRLGKHSTGKGCLYVKRLADIDGAVLETLVAAAWADSAG